MLFIFRYNNIVISGNGGDSIRFQWNEKSIEWFISASVYTGFHKQLAQYILLAVSNCDTVCDFGCGLGRLCIELSPEVKHITAVDINSDTIDQLEYDIKALKINNISPICADTKDIQETYDIGIMSFFGKSGSDMHFYRNLCRKKLIRIVNMENNSTLYPYKYRHTKKETADDVKHELYKNNICYEFQDVYIEFGQPLSAPEDAAEYIRSNAPDITDEELDSFLAEYLISTARKDHPFYIPNLKHIGIFTIHGA